MNAILTAGVAVCMVVVGSCTGAVPGVAQEPTSAAWTLRVVDRTSGTPLAGVLVAFPEYAVRRMTNDEGLVAGEGATALIPVVATRIGYSRLDTLVALPDDGRPVELRMVREAVFLPPLTVQASREMTSRRLHRLMFEREVVVGAIGVTNEEVKAVPAMAEPDIFRSVQSSAGVTSVNDYSGELYVRGGDSDQVSVLLDGSPVFGPYHLFGMFGTFNADAIEYAEFYKGSFPARYGGSLSGVLSARPRTGGDGGSICVKGGLSLLGLRLVADGALPWGGMRWIAGGRTASVDVARIKLPYSFQDFNLGWQAYPSENHRIRFALLASQDQYAWRFNDEPSSTLNADWANVVSSMTWSWVRGPDLIGNVNAYHSHYDATQKLGASDRAPTTTNRISVVGVRAGATLRGERLGGRVGLSIEGGPVNLRGSRVGAFFEGDASRSYLHGSAFAEAELWLGNVRFAPGFRVGVEAASSRVFAEPRLSVRYRHRAFAASASLDQTHQFLSVLRDAVHHAPGAPMWFVRESQHPMTTARGGSLSIDTWRGEEWTGSIVGWARWFHNVPHWRPLAARDLAVLGFDYGSARGVDVTLQRHSGALRGWIAYQWARTGLRDSRGVEYNPHWDRRHELDGTVVLAMGGLTASIRGTIGTGTPFWMPAGRYFGKFFDPRNANSTPVNNSDIYTVWSNTQGRIPPYARFDASIRYALEARSWSIIPYLSVVNVANRPNVIGYTGIGFGGLSDARRDPATSGRWLIPTEQMPRIPFLGIDFRFGLR
ncbi:MAG: TonB-dependent receptor [Gemmatimonadetes bacterium]|nr:TonB-dependent receptor [Gemmatimonadota bacterium]